MKKRFLLIVFASFLLVGCRTYHFDKNDKSDAANEKQTNVAADREVGADVKESKQAVKESFEIVSASETQTSANVATINDDAMKQKEVVNSVTPKEDVKEVETLKFVPKSAPDSKSCQIDDVVETVFSGFNSDVKSKGGDGLNLSEELCGYAKAYACEMADRGAGYFPDVAGYITSYQNCSSTKKTVLLALGEAFAQNAITQSKDNISFTEVGFAYEAGKDMNGNSCYFVAMFVR